MSHNKICILGRGNSGTRVLSHIFSKNGIYMGNPINESGDFLGTSGRNGHHICNFFETIREYGTNSVFDKEAAEWTFKPSTPSKTFKVASFEYLSPILERKTHSGWKLPETIMACPWITALYPELYYVYIVRDYRDSIVTPHRGTDHLEHWNVKYPKSNNEIKNRAYSWKYQYDIVNNNEKPENFIEIKYENLVNQTTQELSRLSDFLGFRVKLHGYKVRRGAVGRWKNNPKKYTFDFLSQM